MDFTFGTFNFTNEAYPGTRVNTTLCKQLALFVVIYSPLQMVLGFTRKLQRHQSVRFH
ncbi:glycoside hydrolase family 97 catalytic domain-containing protein [Bacteroides ovatus]|nr:glycoside hydrolase family 97 catalytic domain-containing protein [Bacteroides ovatus]